MTLFDNIDREAAARIGLRHGSAAPTKAASGPGVYSMTFGTQLGGSSLFGASPQQKARRFLRAYRVGWFYKAGRVIAGDVASLPSRLEDAEGNAVTAAPGSPLYRLARVLDRPNPAAARSIGYPRRLLWERTVVCLDFTGNAFWYLEQPDSLGIPSRTLLITPDRMTPAQDREGNVIGWVMDADSPIGRPVPFAPEEILPFRLGAPDDEIWGVGVVEPIVGEIEVAGAVTRHAQNVLDMGGRLAGMVAPKDRRLDAGAYDEVVRAWRQIASDPDAAKRLLVLSDPVDWTATSVTPAEIGLPELAALNRDQILSAFTMSYTRLGGAAPAGLNSGESRRWDERDYQLHTVHPRVSVMVETIQQGLVDRVAERLGIDLGYIVEEPTFDDAPDWKTKVDALAVLEGLGFDPVDAMRVMGLEEIAYLGRPEPPPQLAPFAGVNPPQPAAPVAEAPPVEGASAAKAAALPGLGPISRRAKRRVASFLRGQRDRTAMNVTRVFGPLDAKARKALPDDWWDEEAEDEGLGAVIGVALREAAIRGVTTAAGRANRRLDDVDLNIDTFLATRGLERAKEINAVTHAALVDALREGTRRGYSAAQLVDGVAAEAFPGILSLRLANGAPAFSDARAEAIGRTETAIAYRDAGIAAYTALGYEYVQAIDGDEDEMCRERDGQVFTLEEADAEDEAEHPNGTLDWLPVTLDDKAEHVPDAIGALAITED